ncbi:MULTISPECIES: Rha family transcriptional regulator [Xenorhabdus]|uniref:Anti-repressor protein n=1 Tax=Xenorhabdus ishibashii TaxID=1034471 RepID=A0A2D0KC05_9GAMM|nr:MULTISPECIES: Rha family transcriptional regulator [Xenorhabdus]PHM39232.1 anti-repressor protein [Xenorhabdus szentirmaii]PHM59139.1 anti-repressor protein [Xenorhabdus ishibashii]PHM59168.1 anti-repressor protein [Xenorhabdus ishibashii]PHM60036.1 anti-repressor protein [Xenorhabdus ishibashii]PHM60042.1 anti-repressor protein [Xenorhabdus ishibashii]
MTSKNMALNGQGLAHTENSQELILVQHRTESRIDSRLFAKRIGIQHKSLYELIRKNTKNLRQFGILPFQTERLNTEQLGERKHKYALLNEDQFDFMCRLIRGRDHDLMVQFKLDVTKAFAKKRAAEPIRREYLPNYHESRDALRDLGAERHHYINLARTENRFAGLLDGERQNADEQQLGLLVCIQKIEQAAFQDARNAGQSPTQALREVSRRIELFATLMNPTGRIGG